VVLILTIILSLQHNKYSNEYEKIIFCYLTMETELAFEWMNQWSQHDFVSSTGD